MKMKKNENDVSDNEFDGEDGEEAQSEEDWEPEDSGKRKSGGRGRAPRKATKKAKVEDDDDDEDDEEDSGKKKKKTPAKGVKLQRNHQPKQHLKDEARRNLSQNQRRMKMKKMRMKRI
ncbi:hypothetical protein WDU94_006044 [Cyamophila willieti]